MTSQRASSEGSKCLCAARDRRLTDLVRDAPEMMYRREPVLPI